MRVGVCKKNPSVKLILPAFVRAVWDNDLSNPFPSSPLKSQSNTKKDDLTVLLMVDVPSFLIFRPNKCTLLIWKLFISCLRIF